METTLPLMLSILGFAFVGYLAWRRMPDALALIALLLPTYLIRFTVAGIPATFLEGMILVVFCVWLIRDQRWKHINIAFWKKNNEEGNRIPHEFRWPLALLLVAAGIAAVLSPAQPAAFGILKAYFIEPMLYLIMLAYEIRTRSAFDRIMAALGLLTIIIGCFAIYQYLTGFGIPNPFWADPAHRRITTFFGYPNANSLLVAPIIAYYLGAYSRGLPLREKLFAVLVIFSGFMTVLMAKTSGAVLALVIVAWILLFRAKIVRVPLIVVTLIAMITLGTLSPLRTELARMTDTVPRNYLNLESSSLEIRINQWRETMDLLSDHPILGGRLANYQAALEPYHQYDFLEIYLYPHNIILNFWTELGLLGVVAMLWLLYRIASTLGTLLRADMLSGDSRARLWGIAASWIVIVTHGLVDVPYFKNDLSILWVIMLGGILVLYHETYKLATRISKSW